jgi:hypothetical protein
LRIPERAEYMVVNIDRALVAERETAHSRRLGELTLR